MVSTTKDPLTFNDRMATPIDFSNIELEYNFQECFIALTDKLDWNNLEGDRYPFDLSKPLPLQGPPIYRTVVVDYFFNNNLEYLKSSDPEKTYTTSIMKTKAARHAPSSRLKQVIPPPRQRHYRLYCGSSYVHKKSSNQETCRGFTAGYGTLKSVRDELHHRVLDFRLDYNTEMPRRKWTVIDRKR
nr:hypothetical protein [Tanacetum cinerariifolium]